MSYSATVLKIMIASPSDVPQERALIRDVIYDWNAIHAEDRKTVLQPIGWESHASPQMGERPQGIINKQVLQGSDILVAAFWTRLGSPTGKSPSGTVEEIEEHIATGKPTLIYFSSAPVRLESVDPKQYEALAEFKKSCLERGLIERYEDLSDFRTKLSRHIAQTIIRLSGSSDAIEIDSAQLSQPVVNMSAEAQELLVSVAGSRDGVIMQINSLEGLHIQSDGRNYVDSGNPRSEARWRAALNELSSAGLVEDRLGVGELFNVTEAGYKAASTLNPYPVAASNAV